MMIDDVYKIIKRDKKLVQKVIYIELGVHGAMVAKPLRRLKAMGFITINYTGRHNIIEITKKRASNYDLLATKYKKEADNHNRIFKMLEEKWMSPREIAYLMGKYQGPVRFMLDKMKSNGRLISKRIEERLKNRAVVEITQFKSIIN